MAKRKYKEDALFLILMMLLAYLGRKLYKKWADRKFNEKYLGMTVNEQIAEVDIMDGRDFERYVENIYKNLGYKTELTPGSGDQGVDVIASKDGVSYAVQVKRYFGTVGNAAVQEVIAGKVFYNCAYGIVVTNSTFTKSAIELAERDGTITLVDRSALKKMILQQSKTTA